MGERFSSTIARGGKLSLNLLAPVQMLLLPLIYYADSLNNTQPLFPPQTLTLARDYAAEVKKPFPELSNVVLEDRDWPRDCYVFEGTEKAPTIVYMPLFNRRNCKGLSRQGKKENKTPSSPTAQSALICRTVLAARKA